MHNIGGETFRLDNYTLMQQQLSRWISRYQKVKALTIFKVRYNGLTGEKDQGCKMILSLKKEYPKANKSVLQKARYEQKIQV